MVIKIIWSQLSKSKLFEIFEYYKYKVNPVFAKNLILNLKNTPKVLYKNPQIGQKEELLEYYNKEIRYLVLNNYKILYHFNQNLNRIEIVNIFDTRQNPTKILE
jgi:plasmid stabilization system protein ParE